MRIKILLLAIALLGFYQYSWASNAVVEHGIEPVMMENFESVDPPEETVEAKILKKEKTGFAKMFSWVKKKVNKTLSFFGIGDDPNSFSIIGFLLGFLLSITFY